MMYEMTTSYRKNQTFIFIVFLLVGFVNPIIGEQKYTPEELITDLNFLIQIMEDVHPNLYAYTPRDEIFQMKSEIKENLTTPLTRTEFCKQIAPLVTRLRDAHTTMIPVLDEYNAYVDEGGQVFPFDVYIRDDRLFVRIDYTEDEAIPPGSEILSINDHPTYDIIKELLQYFSGERMAWRYNILRGYFRIFLWLIYNFGEKFNIDYISSVTGEFTNADLKGISNETITQRRQALRARIPANYEYSSLAELKTGIIDFRSMRDRSAFKSFLKQTFAQLKDEGIEYLIIDIRNNGGGDSRLGEMLLNYITDQPYSQFSGSDVKASKPVKQYFRDQIPAIFRWIPPSLFPHSVYKKIMPAEEGTVVHIRGDLTNPSRNALRFDGEVYVLIGPGTFSSATSFASAIKDHRIGTLVGEETGGLATTYGNNYTFTLPNTMLQGTVSLQKYIRPSGIDDGRGVLPDIEIIAEIDDVVERRDPVMEYVMDLIKDNTI
jgi:hypothetical protein